MLDDDMKRRPFFSTYSQWQHRLLGGLVLVVLTQAIGLGAVGFLGGLGYMITGVACITLMGVFVAMNPKENSGVGSLFFGLGCLGAAFVSGFGMQYQKELLLGETLRGITANDLTRHPRVAYAEFTDAKVFAEFAFSYRYTAQVSKSETRMRQCTVAPLANLDWTPSEPVPAWVALPDSGDASAWARPLQKAGVFSPLDAAAARSAVALATKERNLVGKEDAPVLHWGSHPGEGAQRCFSGSLFIIALMGIPWMVGVLLEGWRHSRTKGPQVHPAAS